jgi:hypothetical protein
MLGCNESRSVELPKMMTALECRRQSGLYMNEAKLEDRVGVRTALLALARSWTTIANQLDRLAELRPVNEG